MFYKECQIELTTIYSHEWSSLPWPCVGVMWVGSALQGFTLVLPPSPQLVNAVWLSLGSRQSVYFCYSSGSKFSKPSFWHKCNDCLVIAVALICNKRDGLLDWELAVMPSTWPARQCTYPHTTAPTLPRVLLPYHTRQPLTRNQCPAIVRTNMG